MVIVGHKKSEELEEKKEAEIEVEIKGFSKEEIKVGMKNVLKGAKKIETKKNKTKFLKILRF